MELEFKTQGYTKGVQNKLPSEFIDQAALSDASNWINVNGSLELARGRTPVGIAGGNGGIFGEVFAGKADGSRVHFVKKNTTIEYFDGTNWRVIISGLTPGSIYTFNPYNSTAGYYVFATGIDGLFKISTSYPLAYKNMYDEARNFKGYSTINAQRMFLWNRMGKTLDTTGLYVSKIDPQGANYTTIMNEVIGTGDGTTKTFSGTLAGATGNAFVFGMLVREPSSQVANITSTLGISRFSPLFTVTVNSVAGWNVGDFGYFTGVAGMTQINSKSFAVATIDPTPTNPAFSFTGDTTSFSAWTSGGAIRRYATTYTDNYNGGIGSIGSLNYATGAYSITFITAPPAGAPVLANYQTENSNYGGITDFTFSSPRLAGEGIFFSQEYLGESIQNVLVFESDCYSYKKTCVYKVSIGTDDRTATNTLFRKDIGIPSLYAGISVGKGMVYMDTSNSSRPILTMLQKNAVSGGLEPVNLTPQFAWEKYVLDNCVVSTWGENIVVSVKSIGSPTNDKLMLVNLNQEYSVDITSYGGNTHAKDAGILYIGSANTDTVFETFSGFDDNGDGVQNFALTKAENYADDVLKKTRYLQLCGRIDENQAYEVYASYDNGADILLGTIRGSQDYVDRTAGIAIGSKMIGELGIGGESTVAFIYLAALKLNMSKFRVRALRFKAIGIGYVSIDWVKDFGIYTFEQRLPIKYRTQAYQSKDGTTNDLPHRPV